MRAIYGAGEQGRVVLDILNHRGRTEDVVFVDDDETLHGKDVSSVTVLGSLEALAGRDEHVGCIVAFGDRPGVRLRLAEKVHRAGYGFFNAIHPDSSISETATFGDGVTVNGQSYVGPAASLGDHVLVDSSVSLSHDVRLADGVTVTPNATLAGGVEVGRDAYIGPGTTVLEDVTVGERAVVGAGAVVTDPVPDDVTVVGVPAEPLGD